jgi:tetratricopeptide (TPR) repeat protein
VEKHLVEQHLTDCDLCFNALQALEREETPEKYQDLTNKLQRYVHNSIQPVSHVQKVAQYTRKEKNKEHMLTYFWVVAFIGLGIGSVYVLRGHMRYQPPMRVMAASGPAEKDSALVSDAAATPVVTPASNEEPLPISHKTTTAAPVKPLPAAPVPAPATTTAKPDSAAIRKAADLKAQQQKKAAADSISRKQALQKQQDSLKKAAADKAKAEEDKKPEPKQENKPAPKTKEKDQAPPETAKKETPPTAINSDEYLYKAAMVYQQQGNLNEAIERYKRIESVSSGKYVEMARYQLAVCYRGKGQMGKARRMFREVIRMDGSMKSAAQQALDSM